MKFNQKHFEEALEEKIESSVLKYTKQLFDVNGGNCRMAGGKRFLIICEDDLIRNFKSFVKEGFVMGKKK